MASRLQDSGREVTRWGHTHSVATGFIGGLLLAANGWLILAALLLAGLVGWWAHALRYKIVSVSRSFAALVNDRLARKEPLV